MKKLRLGMIGIGNMGTGHCRSILEGKCPEIELAAVADIDPCHSPRGSVDWNLQGLCT